MYGDCGSYDDLQLTGGDQRGLCEQLRFQKHDSVQVSRRHKTWSLTFARRSRRPAEVCMHNGVDWAATDIFLVPFAASQKNSRADAARAAPEVQARRRGPARAEQEVPELIGPTQPLLEKCHVSSICAHLP